VNNLNLSIKAGPLGLEHVTLDYKHNAMTTVTSNYYTTIPVNNLYTLPLLA